ncbi:MAG TPA: hypothetical protein DG942_00330 [Ruminococcaceae bacterium]|jgi:predicted methyltransferase|nr:hypothetical protein [Oscillospiraceae bacterium]
MENYINHIFNMDCIAGMAMYPDKSIDMIFSDLPYNMTRCRWDSMIPSPELWKQYLRIVKDNGAIPSTTKLISSQPRLFLHCWYCLSISSGLTQILASSGKFVLDSCMGSGATAVGTISRDQKKQDQIEDKLTTKEYQDPFKG